MASSDDELPHHAVVLLLEDVAVVHEGVVSIMDPCLLRLR
jgi:hypothetical protein